MTGSGCGKLLGLSRPMLLVVDMTNAAANPEFGWTQYHRARGDDAVCAYYTRRLREIAIPNIQELLRWFRLRSTPVCFTSCVAFETDFSDLNKHARLTISECARNGWPNPYCNPQDTAASVLPELERFDGEPVLLKRDYSAFRGTNLESQLRTAGIETLVVVGVGTNYCVQFTVLDAYDAGFDCLLVEDATATLSDLEQEAGLAALAIHADIVNTSTALRRLSQGHAAAHDASSAMKAIR
jgi:ureidoacrylate peracid hydrolase